MNNTDSLKTMVIEHNHHIHFSPVHLGFFGIMALLMIAIFIWQIKFIKEAFSENGVASSKRILAAIFGTVIAICEVFHTVKQESFDYQHLIALLTTICLLLGIATVPQILSAWKGTPNPKDDDKPEQK